MHRLTNITIDQIDRALCLNSFYDFVQIFWNEIITEPYSDNWHIKVICEELQAIGERVAARENNPYDLIINVPPASSKSTLCTVMFPVWLWIKDQTIRSLTGSYSGTLSIAHSVLSRDIIRSKRFRTLFPEVQIRKDFDNKSHYKNSKGGERYATSTGSTVTGFHAHVIIIDDPLNVAQATSEVQLETAKNFITTTLPTRKVNKDKTPTILIMQRLHVEDPTGVLLQQQKKGRAIKHFCFPGKLTEDVRPKEFAEYYIDGLLDPKRSPENVLEELKINLGSFAYAGQILQQPAPTDGGIYKAKDFKTFTDKDLIDDEGKPKVWQGLATFYDLAYTTKTINSASASVTAGKIGNKMYVTDVDFVWKEFPEMIKWMKTKTAPAKVEGKASGKSAVQTLVNNGIPATEVSIEGDKIARAMLAVPYVEAGMVLVHERVIEKLLYAEQQGIIMFPKNSKDDVADAFAMAVECLLGQPQVFTF